MICAMQKDWLLAKKTVKNRRIKTVSFEIAKTATIFGLVTKKNKCNLFINESNINMQASNFFQGAN